MVLSTGFAWKPKAGLVSAILFPVNFSAMMAKESCVARPSGIMDGRTFALG